MGDQPLRPHWPARHRPTSGPAAGPLPTPQLGRLDLARGRVLITAADRDAGRATRPRSCLHAAEAVAAGQQLGWSFRTP